MCFYFNAKSNTSCQVEIDEYSDYAKARDAMDMALKYLAKDTSRAATDMASSIEHRMMLIKKFLSARESAKSDPSTMVAICAALLQEVRGCYFYILCI